MERHATHVEIFPARMSEVPAVTAFTARACLAAGLARDACLRLTLLVEELFTNTVAHGHGQDSEAPVRLVFDVAPGRVGLLYEDTGPAAQSLRRRRAPPTTRPRSRSARWAGSASCSSPRWRARSSIGARTARICISLTITGSVTGSA